MTRNLTDPTTAAARRALAGRLTDDDAVLSATVLHDRQPLAVRGVLADGRVFLFTSFGAHAVLTTAVPGGGVGGGAVAHTAYPGETDLGHPDLAVTVLLDLLARVLREGDGPRRPVELTIQPEPDGLSTPHPYRIGPDGNVADQEFWRGDPAYLLGFRRADDVALVLATQDWWFDPTAALGLYPVFSRTGGSVYSLKLAVDRVMVPRGGAEGGLLYYDRPSDDTAADGRPAAAPVATPTVPAPADTATATDAEQAATPPAADASPDGPPTRSSGSEQSTSPTSSASSASSPASSGSEPSSSASYSSWDNG